MAFSALWWLAWAAPVGALPPCGEPGTISTVTAPDGGDYIAAFSGYKSLPADRTYPAATGPTEKVAAPEYHSYYPQALAVGPGGRIYVADQTIIYRLEADGTATRIVGVPQYSISYSEGDYDYGRHPLGYDETTTYRPPLLQRFNVLEDTVAALDARIAPGAMAFDRRGRLYFVDQVNNRSNREGTAIRIARLEPDGQVITFAGAGTKGYSGDGGPAKEAQFGYISSLVFDPEGGLLIADNSNSRIRRIDSEGVVTTLVQAERVGNLLMDDHGTLYFSTLTQVYRRRSDGTVEHVAGSDWETPTTTTTSVPCGAPPWKGGGSRKSGWAGTLSPMDGRRPKPPSSSPRPWPPTLQVPCMLAIPTSTASIASGRTASLKPSQATAWISDSHQAVIPWRSGWQLARDSCGLFAATTSAMAARRWRRQSGGLISSS